MNKRQQKKIDSNSQGNLPNLPKTIEEMTVADVVKSQLYQKELDKVLNRLTIARQKAREQYGERLKTHPIDRLQKMSDWSVGKMSVLFIKAIDKELDKEQYPSAVRKFIEEVGNQALNQSITILIEQEKHENK